MYSICEQKGSATILTSFSNSVPALQPGTDFLPQPSHITCVDARTPCPLGKYIARPDCTLISTTHRVISALWSTGKIVLLTLCFWTGCEPLPLIFSFTCSSLMYEFRFAAWCKGAITVTWLFSKHVSTKRREWPIWEDFFSSSTLWWAKWNKHGSLFGLFFSDWLQFWSNASWSVSQLSAF